MTTQSTTDSASGDMTEDTFYGQLDNIIMWCFTLGFNAARREYGEQYKSAQEAEPNYEDNLDSWIQDIISSHEEILQSALANERQRLLAAAKTYYEYDPIYSSNSPKVEAVDISSIIAGGEGEQK